MSELQISKDIIAAYPQAVRTAANLATTGFDNEWYNKLFIFGISILANPIYMSDGGDHIVVSCDPTMKTMLDTYFENGSIGGTVDGNKYYSP